MAKPQHKHVPKKSRLRWMADTLWAIAIRDDWGYKCAVCGLGKCDAHHLIPRAHELYRYDLHNGIALCRRCHQFDADVSPHQNAAGWLRWLTSAHEERAEWYATAVESHETFKGTKDIPYFLDVIRSLEQYATEEEFVKVVGSRFAKWLQENE